MDENENDDEQLQRKRRRLSLKIEEEKSNRRRKVEEEEEDSMIHDLTRLELINGSPCFHGDGDRKWEVFRWTAGSGR